MHQLIARGVDLAYAHGIAEDHTRQLGRRLADPRARWCLQPITDNQARRLERLGIPGLRTRSKARRLI